MDEAILANARFLEQVVEDPEIFGYDDGVEDEGGEATSEVGT